MSLPAGDLLSAGERILLIDSKGRSRLITLAAGGQHHTHAGVVPHDGIIGNEDACVVRSDRGARFVVVRPTLAELVLSMPRGAQVIYPKDLGAILIAADIFPGARVLEAGVGSGALSMTLLRAGAEVVGYELREDFARRAQANVKAALGDSARFQVVLADVYEGIEEDRLDRVLLDLPEPWRVVPHAAKALKAGGILLSYLPQITQVAELRGALSAGGFAMAETVEIFQRSWHIEGRAVRPSHRMVGHTGFLTYARRMAVDVATPEETEAAPEPAAEEPTGSPPIG